MGKLDRLRLQSGGAKVLLRSNCPSCKGTGKGGQDSLSEFCEYCEGKGTYDKWVPLNRVLEVDL